MQKKKFFGISLLVSLVVAGLLFSKIPQLTEATGNNDDKLPICHNGNFVWDYWWNHYGNGHWKEGHNDSWGKCHPPTPTPTLPPEVTPTPTLGPDEPTPTPIIPAPTEGTSVGGPPPSGGGGAAPYSCGAAVPQGTPSLISVSPSGAGQMNVSWTAVLGVTHYALSYGPTSGNYLYGVVNTGNTTSFAVGGLDPGENYCFAVRGVNDCAPGPLSNERCSGAVLGAAVGGQVLGLSSTGASSNWESLFYIIGFLWILVGSKFYLLSKRTLKRA